MALISENIILVTGVTGYLGSHLARALHEAGYTVCALKRASSDISRIKDIAQYIYIFDVEDGLDSIFKHMPEIDVIIHTATNYGRRGESVDSIFEANTLFPLRLLHAAITNGTKTFINTDTVLDKYLSAYSLSKCHFSEWGRYLASREELRFLNVRLEHMYGPGDDASKFTTYVIQGCMNNVPELQLTPGEQKRDFIYIDDVVDGYLCLIDLANTQPFGFNQFDLGSGDAVTIRCFAEMVKYLAVSDTHLGFGAIPYRENEVMSSEANVSALVELGWRCQNSLEDGILKTINLEKTR